MFAVLRHPAFRWIWLGALVSNTGNWMEAVAQSWLVQQQTGSPFMVELLAASEFVPHAVLMLAAGWLADHYNRRKLLLAGQSVMMVLGAVLAVAAHLGWATPWVIIAISFAEGAAWASVTPSWQALIPAVVPRSELPAAIALNSAQFNTARLIGPMIAGGLLTAASAAFVFDLNVVSFLGIVVVLALVRVPRAELAAAHTSGGELAHSGGIRPAVRWAIREPGPRMAQRTAGRIPPECASSPPEVWAAASSARGTRTSASTTTIPRKLTTFRSNTNAALAAVRRPPAIIGPINRAVLNWAEFSAMAAGSSLRGTTAGISACQEGVTLAQAAPSAKEMAMITQGVAHPRWAATARTAPSTIIADWPASRSLRRS